MDLKKTNTLVILAVSAVIVVIIGFVTLNDKGYTYKLSVEETLDEIINDSDMVRPEKAFAISKNKHPKYRFIDLRNPHEFTKGHLEDAVNVPVDDLLAEEYQDILNQDEKINILYHKDELRAREAWLLLKQIGYKNNIVLLGGYDFMQEFVLNEYKPQMGSYPDDKAMYDYAKVVKETASSSVDMHGGKEFKIEPPKKIIRKRKVEAEVAGGC